MTDVAINAALSKTLKFEDVIKDATSDKVYKLLKLEGNSAYHIFLRDNTKFIEIQIINKNIIDVNGYASATEEFFYLLIDNIDNSYYLLISGFSGDITLDIEYSFDLFTIDGNEYTALNIYNNKDYDYCKYLTGQHYIKNLLTNNINVSNELSIGTLNCGNNGILNCSQIKIGSWQISVDSTNQNLLNISFNN